MADFSEIEAGLERLMPRGLGDDSVARLEEVIDELAGTSEISDVRRMFFWNQMSLPQGIAAALVLGLLGAGIWSQIDSQSADRSMAALASESRFEEPRSGIEILEQRVWLDGGEDLGIQPLNDSGEASRGWSFAGVEEERVFHVSSGFEVIVQREFEGEHYVATSF